MIGNFQFFRFDIDGGYYRNCNTSLLNKKEIELIQKTNIVDKVGSGDVVYRSLDFYGNIGVGQRDLKDYYVNLLANSGILLSNALSPEKSTLFVEDAQNIHNFGELKKNVAEIDDTGYSYFRKIPYDSLKKKINEERNFSFVVNNYDFGQAPSSNFEVMYASNNYFFILIEDGVKDTVFENETVLKGFSVSIDNSDLPMLIYTLSKSAYSPKIISTLDFVKSVKNLKLSITYEEFVQMESYIGTEYHDTTTKLLEKYDENHITTHSESDPDSFIYLMILKRDNYHTHSRVQGALLKAYSTGKEYLIQTYLSYINRTLVVDLDNIIIVPGKIEFKPVSYYGWNGPSIYSNLDFTKDVENTEEF